MNHSLEEYTSCPIYLGNITAKYWFNPSNNSPDYYNGCVTSSLVGADVPSNGVGYQYAWAGDAYGGITAFYSTTNGREYLEGQLLDTLTNGRNYFAEFYVSLCDACAFATDDIGIYFSKTLIDIDTGCCGHLPFAPQISNTTGYFLNDTTNWMHITGEFIAQGGEKYFIIGNFNLDTNTSLDTINYNANFSSPALYYYFDDVAIYCIDSGYTTADAGPNALICVGDSVQLGTPPQSGFIYSWSPTYGMDPVAGLDSAGATQAQPWVKPQKTTTYILTVVDTVRECRGPGHDSVTVTVCSGVEKLKVKNSEFKLFPNPTGSKAHLQYRLKEKENGKIEILNILGEQIAQYNLNPQAGETVINTVIMENGIYLYRVKVNERALVTERLVVIH